MCLFCGWRLRLYIWWGVVVTLGVCCVASAFDEGDVVAFCMLDFGVCSVLSADATSALADCVVTILTPVVKSDSAKLVSQFVSFS